MFLENTRNFLKYYAKGRRIKLAAFAVLSVFAGGLEFVGIALVYPFILLIINPQTVLNSTYYKLLVKVTGTTDSLINAFILGVLILAVFVAKNVFMVMFLRLQGKFSTDWQKDIERYFMGFFLFAPYEKTLETTTADKIYIINGLCAQVLGNFIFRTITLFVNSLILAMILLLMFIKFPEAAGVAVAFILISITLQSRMLKLKMKQISDKIAILQRATAAQIVENIEHIKEIKLMNMQQHFYDLFKERQEKSARMGFEYNFYVGIPPYLVETLIVGALLLIGIVISMQSMQDTTLMLASYSVIAAAIFRIAPALNRIQTSVIGINSCRGTVKMINNFFVEYEAEENVQANSFKEFLEVKDLNFAYLSGKRVLKGINLKIKKGEHIGIVGLSGAGKTTLTDVLTGLLTPDSGEILLDGKSVKSLRGLVSYVPQEICVLDGSYKRNVSWGSKEADEKRIVDALKKAQLWEVVKESPQGIEAEILKSENGLSQGQKQRLAIARAIYQNKEIMIFDEATSALDVQTEHEITQIFDKFDTEKTVLIIAHRLSTLKTCDSLIYVKEGEIVDSGTFAELSARHEDFKKLVELSNLN